MIVNPLGALGMKCHAQEGMSLSVSSHTRYALRGTRFLAISQRTVMDSPGSQQALSFEVASVASCPSFSNPCKPIISHL